MEILQPQEQEPGQSFFGPDGGIFTDPSNPTTTYTSATPGVYVFEWTVSNDECTNADQVRITNYDEPSVADAGDNQNQVCGTEATMDANLPTVGIGEWTLVSKPAGSDPIITSLIQPQTTVTNLVPDIYPGTYTFKWAISNGICVTNTSQVDITVYQEPTAAYAGDDQEFCELATTNLEGNTITIGSGLWSLVSKPTLAADPTIVTPASPTSQVTGLEHGTYVFDWTSTENVVCTSTDEVSITNYGTPTTANASATATQLCQYDALILEGNTPDVGTGLWTQLSGSTVTILNPSSPTTNVVGFVIGTYGFTWTISNGDCFPSSNNVTVTVYDEPSQADAGADQSLCNVASATTTNTQLEGNEPTSPVSGLWTIVSNPTAATLTFDDNTLYNATISGLVPGEPATYELEWTHAIGICEKSNTMFIDVWAEPSTAAAGSDQTHCNTTSITLDGNNPAVGTGKWVRISGPNASSITTPNLYNTTVTGLIPGTYVYRWRITNGPGLYS